jgi:4-hydroxy 2-oxovalerate aldolase
MSVKLIDCTLRDGGYYTDWDFTQELVLEYLHAMAALDVDFVEIGFRFVDSDGFKGGYAFSTDDFIHSISIPLALQDKIGVMINGVDLLPKEKKQETHSFQHEILNKLFKDKADSPVTLVRIACHAHEFADCLPAATWLKSKGYVVGFNLMQISNCTDIEIKQLAEQASRYPIDVLYFADSMGNLDAEQTKKIIHSLKQEWTGELGIHTHDNMGQAISNTLQSIKEGVTWVDSTVTGMGRGPGNAQTEYLVLSLSEHKPKSNPTKLFELISKRFKPLQNKYGWGTNPYYYLAGKFSIHPTFIQEMLLDTRFSEEDIIAVIDNLKGESGKKFNLHALDAARHFYDGEPRGSWNPADLIKSRDILILGTGLGVLRHKKAIEAYIQQNKPLVMALNTQSVIAKELVDVRIACHPVRLLADCNEHLELSQPLVTPASMLPGNVKKMLEGKELLDYGIEIKAGRFEFNEHFCTLPNSLVVGYAFAIASCGSANCIFLAGFDGYGEDDARRKEMDGLLKVYTHSLGARPIISITPTRYEITTQSVYGMSRPWLK